MSSRPWMPLYVDNFRAKTLDLGADEIGVYMILLMLAWLREDAAIPNDLKWLKRSLKCCIADFHGHTFNRIVPKLLDRYFSLGADNKWRNKRLTSEREKTDKRLANGRQTVGKRSPEIIENNNLATTQSQSQSQRKKDIEASEVKGVKKEPRHGAMSKDKFRLYCRKGTSEFTAYATQFHDATGAIPFTNQWGGRWFKFAGEAMAS